MAHQAKHVGRFSLRARSVRTVLKVAAACGLALYLGLLSRSMFAISRSASDPAREHTFDFGPVGQGESHRHDFVLKNDSSSDVLQIIALRTSCMCTTVPDELMGVRIAPNSSLTIPVTLRTGTAAGSASSSLSLSTVLHRPDGSLHTRVDGQYILRADVVPLFTLRPEAIDFGQIHDTSPTTRRVTISSRQFPATRIVSAKSSEPAYSVQVNDPTTIANDQYTLDVTFTPPFAAKTHTYAGFIHVATTSDRVPHLSLPVRARLVPPVTVRPHVAIFSGATHDQPMTLEILSTAPSTVTEVISRTSDFVAVAEPDATTPADVHYVTVTPASLTAAKGELLLYLQLKPAEGNSTVDRVCTVAIPMFHLPHGD